MFLMGKKTLGWEVITTTAVTTPASTVNLASPDSYTAVEFKHEGHVTEENQSAAVLSLLAC